MITSLSSISTSETASTLLLACQSVLLSQPVILAKHNIRWPQLLCWSWTLYKIPNDFAFVTGGVQRGGTFKKRQIKSPWWIKDDEREREWKKEWEKMACSEKKKKWLEKRSTAEGFSSHRSYPIHFRACILGYYLFLYCYFNSHHYRLFICCAHGKQREREREISARLFIIIALIL